MEIFIEFISSLGAIGWALILLCALIIINLRKIIRLRSPLDSPQHKAWRKAGGTTKADHLESNDIEI